MRYEKMTDICTPTLMDGAIRNDEYPGFLQDYLVLHCLIRRAQPQRIMEIGTNMGLGTKILKNAWPHAEVFSLDLPSHLAHVSLQHPISEKKSHGVGSRCDLPYTQLFGDSRTFDFAPYAPADAWYIDAEHAYENVLVESKAAVANGAKLVVWHDADIPGVWQVIAELFGRHAGLVRVEDTRIAYLTC